MIAPEQLQTLEQLVRELYHEVGASKLAFHGWPHICFVRKKAVEFAERNGADQSIVSAAALVHDLNYIAEPNSEPIAGLGLRQRILGQAGIPVSMAAHIEALIDAAHTANRGPHLSAEAAALSDADTLFKALPITPVALSHFFRVETGLSLSALAAKIVGEQRLLMATGIYFYDAQVERDYGKWARTNLALWSYVTECLDDPDVRELLHNMGVK